MPDVDGEKSMEESYVDPDDEPDDNTELKEEEVLVEELVNYLELAKENETLKDKVEELKNNSRKIMIFQTQKN